MSTHASALTTPRKVVPDLPACEFACNGPRRHEGPQGATPRTRSASTTPVWTAVPKLYGRPHAAEDISSCSATPEGCSLRVTPTGPLRDGAAGQHPPALRGFCTPTQCACGHPTSTQAHRTGTRPPPWYPQRWLPRVAQAILGPARLVSTTPPTQPGGKAKAKRIKKPSKILTRLN